MSSQEQISAVDALAQTLPFARASVAGLGDLARDIRRDILEISYRTRPGGHLGSAFSIVDILTVLYFNFLRFPEDRPDHPLRDRFILSKGHAALALYTTLAHRGFFEKVELSTFVQDNSSLTGHPEINCVPGVEISSGSLGHGLSMGVGMALAQKHDNSSSRVVVLVSDGECNEGSIWEAAQFAGHHGLDNLTVIVDSNKFQALGRTAEVINPEPFADKWRAFGWEAEELDGHSHDALGATLNKLPLRANRPTCLIAHTLMGKGVSFMEDKLEWHYYDPKDDHYTAALAELTS